MSVFAYRKEPDGVRAIAVFSVVLFHVGYPDMTGGYVGVDIVFVLSGYLVCGQTSMRLKAGTYSVTEFFACRIRRLSTACAACLLVTALAPQRPYGRSDPAGDRGPGRAACGALRDFLRRCPLLSRRGGLPPFTDNVHLGPLSNEIRKGLVEEALGRGG